MNKEKISIKDELSEPFPGTNGRKPLTVSKLDVDLFQRLGMIRRIFSQKTWTKEGVV